MNEQSDQGIFEISVNQPQTKFKPGVQPLVHSLSWAEKFTFLQ